MPQTKNADGLLHQRFCVPLTRRQALPALQRFTRSLLLYSSAGPYSRFSALHATQLPYPSAGPYPRFSALLATQLPYPASGPYPRFSALHATMLLYTPKGLYPSKGPYPRFSALHATQPPPSPSLLGRAGVGLPTSYPSTFSFLYRKAPFLHDLARLFASVPYRDGDRDSSF